MKSHARVSRARAGRPGVVSAPDLAAGARLAQTLRHASWFAALGEPLTTAERAEAEAYLAALGVAGRSIAAVADWRAAERIARDPDWDVGWWEAEETLRQTLWRRLSRDANEHDLLAALSQVTDAASGVVLGQAAIAAARSGIADPALIRVAAGAATQAAYQAALAEIARAGSAHAFAVKYRLYAAGRWPLGVVGGAFYLF